MQGLSESMFSFPKIPALNMAESVTMAGELLGKAFRLAGDVSERLALSIGPEGFGMGARGETDDAQTLLSPTMLKMCKATGEARSEFQPDYIGMVVKAVGSADVTVSLGSDYPAKFEWALAGGKGKVVYLIAPCVGPAE